MTRELCYSYGQVMACNSKNNTNSKSEDQIKIIPTPNLTKATLTITLFIISEMKLPTNYILIVLYDLRTSLIINMSIGMRLFNSFQIIFYTHIKNR